MTAKVERERAGAVERSKILRFSPSKPSCMAAFYRRWWSDRVAVGRRRGVWRACDGGWSAGVGGRSAVSGKRDGDGMAGCRERRHGVCSLEKGKLHFGPSIYDCFNCILNWFKIFNAFAIVPLAEFQI